MRTLVLTAAMGLALPSLFARVAGAKQPPVFLCAAPAGHVCQFVVQLDVVPGQNSLIDIDRRFARH